MSQLPPGKSYSHNVEALGYCDFGGKPAFKLAVQEVKGRWYLYVAHLWHPGWTVVDVTDPANPVEKNYIKGPDNTWTIQVQVAEGKISPADVTQAVLANHLDTGGMPDPDLLIRTSGEQRLSNFLLWQCAYSELVFVPIYWPDFDRQALDEAVAVYRQRERRFGGLAAKARS